MSSFTVNIERPYQFNDFVQTTPIKAMVEVGMAKQQQYDQNVQRIKGDMENIAGLPVMRGVDQQYLQSTLNSMTEQLRGVGAADFSKTQLMDSVGGMTRRISKDPNIVAAVQSTENHRSQQVLMEEARQKGELTPANEYAYQQKLSGYLNNDQIGKVFTDKYDTFHDTDKQMREAFAAVLPDGMTYDEVFLTDANGQKVIKDGKYVPSATMTRLKKEGRFPEKVQAVINSVLADSRVQKQMAIDGNYAYRGTSPAKLKEILGVQQTQENNRIDDQIMALNLEKATASADKQKEIDIQIAKLEQGKEQIAANYKTAFATADAQPDAIRSFLYKQEKTASWTSMFGNQKVSSEIMESPLESYYWKRDEAARDERWKSAEFNQKLKQFEWEKRKFGVEASLRAQEIAVKAKNKNPDGSTNITSGFDIDFQSSSLSPLLQEQQVLGQAGNNLAMSSDGLLFQTVFTGAKNEAQVNKFMAQGMTLEQARRQVIDNTAKANNETPEQFRARWVPKAAIKANEMLASGNGTSTGLKIAVKNAEEANKVWQQVYGNKVRIDEMLGKETVDVDLSKTLSSVKPVEVNLDGRKVRFSEQDILDLATARSGGITASKEINDRAKEAKKRLAQKRIPIDIIGEDQQVEGYNLASLPTKKYPPEMKMLREQVYSLENKMKNKTYQSSIERRSQLLTSTGLFSPSLKGGVLTGDTEIDKGQMQNILDFATNYAANKQNLSPNFDVKAITNVLNSKDAIKSIQAKAEKDAEGNVSVKLVFSGSDGEVASEMFITNSEAAKLGINTTELYKPDIVKRAEATMALNQNKSTSPFGALDDMSTYTGGTAFITKTDIPGMKNSLYDVKAHVQKVQVFDAATNSYSDQYIPWVYVKDIDGLPKLVTLDPAPSLDKALQGVQLITPPFVQKLLLQK